MNFDYLDGIASFEQLKKYCLDAEKLMHDYPEASAISMRKAMEFAVKFIYGTEVNSNFYGLSVYDMLEDPAMINFIGSKRLIDICHTIRKSGNAAAHNDHFHPEDVQQNIRLLHELLGEFCILLGVINNYQPYCDDLKQLSDQVLSDLSEPVLDPDLFVKFNNFSRVRHPELTNPNYIKPAATSEFTDPRKLSELKNNQVGFHGTSTAMNSQYAFHETATWLENVFGTDCISVDYKKYLICLQYQSKKEIIAVRTGCCKLATRKEGEDWDYMPGIQKVLYATSITDDKPIANQLHLFSSIDFVQMWKDLGFVRAKMSKGYHDLRMKFLVPGEKLDTVKEADQLSVQSFNTAKKSKQDELYRRIDEHPLLDSLTIEQFFN